MSTPIPVDPLDAMPCLLTYEMSTTPSRIAASTLGSDLSLDFVVTNATGGDVLVETISITLFVDGADATALASSTSAAQGTEVNGFTWSIQKVTSGLASCRLECGMTGPVTIAKGTSLIFSLYDVALSGVIGTGVIYVTETTQNGKSPRPFIGQSSFVVTKYPEGFAFHSLYAATGTGASPPPVAQVPRNTKVKLFWKSAGIDASAVDFYYSTLSGPVKETATANPYELKNALTTDTIITAVANYSDAVQTLSYPISIAVGVVKPSIDVNDAVVETTLNVTGASTLSGATAVGSTLGVTGVTTLSAKLVTATTTDAVTIGAWTIGVDAGGNLVFANGAQAFTLTAAGAVQLPKGSGSSPWTLSNDGNGTLNFAPAGGTTSSMAASGAFTSQSMNLANGWVVGPDTKGSLQFQGGNQTFLMGNGTGLTGFTRGGNLALFDGDGFYLSNYRGTLNSTMKFGGGGANGFNGAAYWTGSPDGDSNLTITHGGF